MNNSYLITVCIITFFQEYITLQSSSSSLFHITLLLSSISHLCKNLLSSLMSSFFHITFHIILLFLFHITVSCHHFYLLLPFIFFHISLLLPSISLLCIALLSSCIYHFYFLSYHSFITLSIFFLPFIFFRISLSYITLLISFISSSISPFCLLQCPSSIIITLLCSYISLFHVTLLSSSISLFLQLSTKHQKQMHNSCGHWSWISLIQFQRNYVIHYVCCQHISSYPLVSMYPLRLSPFACHQNLQYIICLYIWAQCNSQLQWAYVICFNVVV